MPHETIIADLKSLNETSVGKTAAKKRKVDRRVIAIAIKVYMHKEL